MLDGIFPRSLPQMRGVKSWKPPATLAMVVGHKPSQFRTISRMSTSTKATVPSRKSNYQGQDSNLHAFRHQILSLARLPIPPPWQIPIAVCIILDTKQGVKF